MTTISNNRTATLVLEYPFEYKGSTLKQVVVRRPKGADMRFLPKGDNIGAEDMFPFFSVLTGIEEQALDEMDAADITSLGELVNDFLSKKKRRR